MEFNRGSFYSTKTLRIDGDNGSYISGSLTAKAKHMVLLLNTQGAKDEYTRWHCLDDLGNLGFTTFDDIKACLGEEAAKKVLAFSEAKIKAGFEKHEAEKKAGG